MSFIVFDLVLYNGQWSNNVKHGHCKHFVTYRNYYVPQLSTKILPYTPPPASSAKTSFLQKFVNLTDAVKKYDYPGHTTVEAILKEAQLLSGCFFSGRWEQDLLSTGSLFYFHRLFCLRFNGKKQSKWLDCNDKDDLKVTYFDCRTASHFSVKWEKQEAVEYGIWNIGCVASAKPQKTTSTAQVPNTEPDNLENLHKEHENPHLQRLPDLTRKIRSKIVFNESSEHEHVFIDVKDG